MTSKIKTVILIVLAKLMSALEDNSGGISIMRIICLCWITVLASVWLLVSIHSRTIADIPNGVLMLTGWLVSGKVVQRFAEKSIA